MTSCTSDLINMQLKIEETRDRKQHIQMHEKIGDHGFMVKSVILKIADQDPESVHRNYYEIIQSTEISLTSRYWTYAYRNAIGLYLGKQIGENDSDVLHKAT